MQRVSSSLKALVHVAAALTLLLVSTLAAEAAPTFVYALQNTDGPNQIFGFSLDPATSTLTLLPGFPVATGGNGNGNTPSEALTYNNGRLFAINGGSQTLSVFNVNGLTGGLTATPYSPIALPETITVAYCVAVHPSGSPVVVGGTLVASFALTATTATAAPGSPYTTESASYSCRFSVDGNYAYVGGQGATIAGYAVQAGTGQLTSLPESSYVTGEENPLAYATDASGRLYLAHFASGQARVFTTASGVPTVVADSPVASGLSNAIQAVLHPAGFYIVTDRTSNSVGVFRITGSGSATTLNAVPGSPFAAGGTFTQSVALTPAGGFLIAANGGTHNLSVFTVNTSTGLLTAGPVQPVNTIGAIGNISGLTVVSERDIPVAATYDSDARADAAVFRPSTGIWYEQQTTTDGTAFEQWGVAGDVHVPGDFDGDGRADVAVWRPSTGMWYVRNSSTLSTSFYQWGLNGDIPVPDDFDGDGRTDIAVWRPSTGIWYIRNSSTDSPAFLQWGLVGDIPVPGDFDGDGKADATVFRPSTGIWYVRDLVTNTAGFYQWGVNGDTPVRGDFDGDGKADVAVWRPSTGMWYLLLSTTQGTAFYQWGLPGDVPVPGDFDGDGKTDVAVYRPSTGIWYFWNSSTSSPSFLQWGLPEP